MPLKEELEKFIKQSKLNEQELKEYLKASKNMNPKLDHDLAYRIMMNETRRNLLKYIGTDIRDIREIEEEFRLESDQLMYHLAMLKQGLYIINSNNKWKSTPRGLGFLENAIMG